MDVLLTGVGSGGRVSSGQLSAPTRSRSSSSPAAVAVPAARSSSAVGLSSSRSPVIFFITAKSNDGEERTLSTEQTRNETEQATSEPERVAKSRRYPKPKGSTATVAPAPTMIAERGPKKPKAM